MQLLVLRLCHVGKRVFVRADLPIDAGLGLLPESTVECALHQVRDAHRLPGFFHLGTLGRADLLAVDESRNQIGALSPLRLVNGVLDKLFELDNTHSALGGEVAR